MKKRFLLIAYFIVIYPIHAQDAPGARATGGAGSGRNIIWVPGSTQKICQIIGETDPEFGIPTASRTESRYGLTRGDHGYSFEHHGKLYFLFGDTHPADKFNGQKNSQTDPPRSPDANDAIGYCSDTSAGPCLRLDFIAYPDGAYKNPVVLNAQGQPAIKLRTNESPISGISDGGRMYVTFGTDNPIDTVTPPAQLGHPASSVLAVSDDDGMTFHYQYYFSRKPGARFVYTAIAPGADGYIYFWGTQSDSLYRLSAVYLARKPSGSMSDSTAIEYLRGTRQEGAPLWGRSESEAAALFHDSIPGPDGRMQVADGMSTLGVQWNPFVKRWVMLYNCLNDTPTNPRGIYMRLATQPWGPWSAPQTIFNPVRDNGYCYFIHRAVTPGNPPCDTLCGPDRMADPGGDYGPFFISRFTAGDSAKGSSTFYWTMDTWNPYTQVIMQTSIMTSPATDIPSGEGAAPLAFGLREIRPNPFSSGTMIGYRIAERGGVTLKVYDLLGRGEATLLDAVEPAGDYSISFDGSGLKTGVHFVRLEAGGSVDTRKLVLVR